MRGRVTGWATTLLLVCLAIGLVAASAWLGAPDGGNTIALALGAAGLLTGLVATRRASRAEAHDAKLAEELDAFSRRLVALEDRLAGGLAEREKQPRPDDMRELSADLEALSAAFRSLAEAVDAHDRDIAGLRSANRPQPTPVSASLPERTPVSSPEPAPVVSVAAPVAPARPTGTALLQPAIPGLADRGPAFLAALDALAVPSFLPQAPAAPEPAAALPAPARFDPPALADERDGAVRDATLGRTLDPHVAAIVTLPQRRTLVHEMLGLLPLADGTVLLPSEYRPAIARLDLGAELDGQLLAHAMEAADALGASGREGVVATPLSRRTLVDPVALERAVQTIGDGPAAQRIILTLDGSEWPLPPAIRDVLARLGRRGVGFALSGLETPPTDPTPLAAAGIRYVKVPAARLFDPERPDETAAATEAVCRRLAEHGIRLVASDVSEDALVPELIDCAVPLAQGYALAIPVPVATLLAPGAAAPIEAPPAETRRPLRSVLRRIG